MEKKKSPDINFHGLNQQWYEKKLKNVSFKVIEKNLNNLYTETFTNSAQFGVVSQRDFFDKDISNVSSIKGYYVVKENDFIYNPRISNYAPVGPIKRNKLGRIGVVSPLYFVFRAHDVDYQFLETYFESSKWHPFMLLSGDTGARSDRLAIKDSIFIEMPIYCPDEKIQKEIGSFFQKLDQSITLQEKKRTQTQNLKKAMLEKMFPKAGNEQPEIRLKGFSGDWNSIRILDLAQSQKLNNGVFNDQAKVGKGYKLINVLDMYIDTSIDETRLTLLDLDKKEFEQNKVRFGDIFFTRSSLVKEGIAFSNVYLGTSSDITYDGHLIKLSPNLEIVEPIFLNYCLKSSKIRTQLILGGKSTTMTTIGQQEVGETIVGLPRFEEQMKIGQFFLQLDETLVLQQQQLQTLKNLKQAFLEKMFV